jgi:hypothetical protein
MMPAGVASLSLADVEISVGLAVGHRRLIASFRFQQDR